MFPRRHSNGFTLLEALLAVSIIGVLALTVILSLGPGRMLAMQRNGSRSAHLNDLIGAIAAYTLDNEGELPPSVTLPPAFNSTVFSGANLIQSGFVDALSVAAADMDGDGDTDIVAGGKGGGGEVSWWEHSGSGIPSIPPITWTKRVIGSGFEGWVVKARDIDGDGRVDIAGANKGDGEIAWWRNAGGTPPSFGAPVLIETGYEDVRSLDIADVDADGDLDVVAGSDNQSAVRWYRNNGNPLTPDWDSKNVESATNDFIGETIGADVDGDGHTDIVGAYENTVTWWVNSGTPWEDNWVQYRIDATSDQERDVFPADVDGDGDTDVVAISTGGSVSFWENDGMPRRDNWPVHSVTAGFGGNRLTLADMDLDGDLDILGGSEGGDKIAWWENGGGGSFSGTSIVETGSEADGVSEVTAADVDGDGDMDIVAVMEVAETAAWWENRMIAGVSSPAPVASIDATGKAICKEGVSLAECDANGGVSLDVLVPAYIASLPVDPLSLSDPLMTGYTVRIDPGTPNIFLAAPLAELGKTIGLSGSVGTSNCIMWSVINGENTCVLFE